MGSEEKVGRLLHIEQEDQPGHVRHQNDVMSLESAPSRRQVLPLKN